MAKSESNDQRNADQQESTQDDPNDVVLRLVVTDVDVGYSALLGLSPGQQVQQVIRHDPMLSLGDEVVKLVPEPANPAGKFRALFGADGVAPPRNI